MIEWQSGLRATECRFVTRQRHTGLKVRTLCSRNILGGDNSLFFFGLGFLLGFGYLWKERRPRRQGSSSLSLACSRPAAAAALELPKITPPSFLKIEFFIATTKRLREQLASVSERERLVAAAEGCVCVVCVLSSGVRRLSQTPQPNKTNQLLPPLSPHKTNTIIREERADKKGICSLSFAFLSALLFEKPKEKKE